MVAWGRSRENGIWWLRGPLASRKLKLRLRWRNHDSLFVRVGRLSFRIMKPWRA